MTVKQGLDPLRSYDEWAKSVRNFHAWLGTAVPGASDIDLMVERSGNFLVIEAKPWTNGVTLGYGQHLALARLCELDSHSVYLVGESDEKVYVMAYSPHTKPITSKKSGKLLAWFPPKCFLPATRDGLKETVAEWWNRAGG